MSIYSINKLISFLSSTILCHIHMRDNIPDNQVCLAKLCKSMITYDDNLEIFVFNDFKYTDIKTTHRQRCNIYIYIYIINI